MNTDFKINGQSYRFATSAENVKYGSGTVKDALDDIKSFDTSGMSEFGKKLYAADEKEFYRLLGISKAAIFDEHQNLFTSSYPGVYLTDSQPRTDASQWSLRLNEASFWSAAPIEFGGQPFTITFSAYTSAYDQEYIFRALGSTYSFGLARLKPSTNFYTNESDWKYHLAYVSGTISVSPPSSAGSVWSSLIQGSWTTFQLKYNGSGSLQIYQGGELKKTVSKTVPSEPRRLIFGSCTGFFDEFKLIDDGTEKVHLAFE